MIERFLTTEQVANILQVHPFTVLKFIKAGKLKGVKLGRVYRIQEGDVLKFLESRTTHPGHQIKETSEEIEPKKEEQPTEQYTFPDDGEEDHYHID